MSRREEVARAIHGAMCPGEEEFDDIDVFARELFMDAADSAMVATYPQGESAVRLDIYRDGYVDGCRDARSEIIRGIEGIRWGLAASFGTMVSADEVDDKLVALLVSLGGSHHEGLAR